MVKGLVGGREADLDRPAPRPDLDSRLGDGGAFVAATTSLFVSDFRDRGYLLERARIVASNAGMRLLGLTSGATVGSLLHREFVTLAALASLMVRLRGGATHPAGQRAGVDDGSAEGARP